MTLRKRLFWLLLLILLLVLPAVAMLGQRLLLAERDNEDHQDLHRLSTLLQHSLERHARYQLSRLEGLALRLALDDRSPATLPGEADALLLIAPPAPAEVLFSRLDEKTLARVLTEPVGQGLSPRVRLEWLEEPLLLLEVPLPDGKGRLLASQRLDARRLFGGWRHQFAEQPAGIQALTGQQAALAIRQRHFQQQQRLLQPLR